ncbi:hypothetical protein SLEP1_g351 [Rubroshorea leprosula]|uniref:Ubiquitin-like domain-containing protein n=1 Tax=Rubroshorea leprosula TaxID=152421 RepID=A0AAV5HHA4_9ROSI|nr:hypothetical protein SLEP1_g351 [Rubroshorea leprosula]
MASSSAPNDVSVHQLDKEKNIYLKITKTVACKVKLSETVKNLKELLREKGVASEEIQHLFFAGNRLEDSGRLVDHGVQMNSTLNLIVQDFVGIKLIVEIPSGQRTIVVEARANDTVQNVKSLIEVKEGLHSDQFMLVFNGEILDKDRTLTSLGVYNEATLHLVFCQKDMVSILVNADNLTVKLQVKVMFTIGDVKAIAARMLGVSAGDLMYAGKKLEDLDTLASYNIKDESVLEMVHSKFQVFVKTWGGKTLILDVYGSSTVIDVKEMIFQKLKFPVYLQSITYAGKRLENEKDLKSYNIHRHCTLQMVLAPSSRFLHVTVSALFLSVTDLTTIRTLKRLLNLKGYPVKEVILNKVALCDECTLGYYGIKKNSKVVLCLEYISGNLEQRKTQGI